MSSSSETLSYDSVRKVERAIAGCDVKILSVIKNRDVPWIIAVGEHSKWLRHLVVDEVSEDGEDATLRILTAKQSDEPFASIDTQDVDKYISLKELIGLDHAGVLSVLHPASAA